MQKDETVSWCWLREELHKTCQELPESGEIKYPDLPDKWVTSFELLRILKTVDAVINGRQ